MFNKLNFGQKHSHFRKEKNIFLSHDSYKIVYLNQLTAEVVSFTLINLVQASQVVLYLRRPEIQYESGSKDT